MSYVLETIETGLAFARNGAHAPVVALAARAGVSIPTTFAGAIADWQSSAPVLEGLARVAADTPDLWLRGAKVFPQFASARKVICAGANYYRHLAEMNVAYTHDATKAPFIFLKPPTALEGPLRADPTIHMLDWEVEMVAVIGRRGANIDLADALSHVAGYTVAVDITARDRLMQPDSIFKFDFLSGKGRDGYCPIANGFVPAALLGDPQAARLRLAVNGAMKQDESTSDMIYSVAELIVWASRLMTLEPGDLLLTGSPAGVGFPKREFLRAGDVMTVELAPHLSFESAVIG